MKRFLLLAGLLVLTGCQTTNDGWGGSGSGGNYSGYNSYERDRDRDKDRDRDRDDRRAPGGSYRASCRDIQVDDGVLEAKCRSANGEYRQSRLRMDCNGEISNEDGRLTCLSRRDRRDNDRRSDATPPSGSYQGSCRDWKMQNGTLSARCEQRNGEGWRSTSIKVSGCKGDITNSDGRLTCGR
jgi:hypothetical protein